MNKERAVKILRQTTYWVYDPDSDCFGPGKFVGYRNMTWNRYEAALAGHFSGAIFDGGVTSRALSAVLGEFQADQTLVDQLIEWSSFLFGASLFGGANHNKWQFARLNEIRRYWALLCDPERFRGLEAVAALDEIVWSTDRGEPKVGDRVLLWQAKGTGNKRGVIALGGITAGPEIMTTLPKRKRFGLTIFPNQLAVFGFAYLGPLDFHFGSMMHLGWQNSLLPKGADGQSLTLTKRNGSQLRGTCGCHRRTLKLTRLRVTPAKGTARTQRFAKS